jgi:lipoprotein signal peptidase
VSVARRRWLLAAVAVPLAAVDLLQKASEPVYGHPRSVVYVAGALALAVLLVAFVPRVPSAAVAVAAGVAVAGDGGNLVAALVWRGGVPNPIVAGDVAFNLADAYAVVGSFALVFGSTLFALRNRALLRQRV